MQSALLMLQGFVEIESIPTIVLFSLVYFIVGSLVAYVLLKMVRVSKPLGAVAGVAAIVSAATALYTVVLFNIIEYHFFYTYGLYERVGEWIMPTILLLLVVLTGAYLIRTRLQANIVKSVLISVVGVIATLSISFVLIYSAPFQSILSVG